MADPVAPEASFGRAADQIHLAPCVARAEPAVGPKPTPEIDKAPSTAVGTVLGRLGIWRRVGCSLSRA